MGKTGGEEEGEGPDDEEGEKGEDGTASFGEDLGAETGWWGCGGQLPGLGESGGDGARCGRMGWWEVGVAGWGHDGREEDIVLCCVGVVGEVCRRWCEKVHVVAKEKDKREAFSGDDAAVLLLCWRKVPRSVVTCQP